MSSLHSCGDHYNPLGRQHGGPGDSERVCQNSVRIRRSGDVFLEYLDVSQDQLNFQ